VERLASVKNSLSEPVGKLRRKLNVENTALGHDKRRAVSIKLIYYFINLVPLLKHPKCC
jgi:hypothetical protein